MFYSDCCGAEIPLDGVDYGICPECKEHCEVIEEEDESAPLEVVNFRQLPLNHNKEEK